jgi:hypothetical protein
MPSRTLVSPGCASPPTSRDNHRTLRVAKYLSQGNCFQVFLRKPAIKIPRVQSKGLPRCCVYTSREQRGHLFETSWRCIVKHLCRQIVADASLQVFLGTQWKELDFSIVQNDFQKVIVSELGIQQHPPPTMLLDFLERVRPPGEDTARRWFEYLSECIQSKCLTFQFPHYLPF